MTRVDLKEKWLHPNRLTLYRIVAVPIIILLMLWPTRFFTFIVALVFSAAAITDYLDGWYARKYNLVSNFGKIMDPLADKLLVACTLIMLTYQGWIPGWVVCVVIGREIAITGLRNFIAEQKEDLSATNLGKYKTGFQIAAIIPLLFHYPYFGIDLHIVGMFFLWGALILSVWSGIDYFYRFRKMFDDAEF